LSNKYYVGYLHCVPFTSEKNRADRPEFIFVGEHPAIDFSNTVSISQGELTDHFRAWPDVVDWLSLTGTATDPRLNLSASRSVEALKSVVALRQAWKAVLVQILAGGKVSDEFLERLNRLLRDETFYETLHREGKQSFDFVRSVSQLCGEKLALAILARQIAAFLAKANLNYLRRCANTTSCALYFYDTTKNHRRRWCSQAACGNRHKVAEFRKRQKKPEGKGEVTSSIPGALRVSLRRVC
jgi:predicted RNA-binding Zn ribbon-like protein